MESERREVGELGQLWGDGLELVVTQDEGREHVQLTQLRRYLLESVATEVEIGESVEEERKGRDIIFRVENGSERCCITGRNTKVFLGTST